MCGVVGIVAHFAGADVFKQGVVFELIGVFFVACTLAAWRQIVDEKFAAVGEIGCALGAVEVLADIARALATDPVMALKLPPVYRALP